MTLTLVAILIPYIDRIWCLTVRIAHLTKSDLDADIMTLILKLDLDMVKMSHHEKNILFRSMDSKVIACTDGQCENITLPYTCGGKIYRETKKNRDTVYFKILLFSVYSPPPNSKPV